MIFEQVWQTSEVIVSSMSGRGKAGREWPEIAARLEARRHRILGFFY